MRSYLAFLALILPSVVLGAIGPTANLYINNKNISPDGFQRPTVLAASTPNGGTFPGPLIKGNVGDTFNLNVVNQLNNPAMLTSTSIHWHGMVQKGSNWADGVVGVTQCPISPGHSFNYKFSSKGQAGTYWYHSHFSTQYCDGLRGALVVYDPNDPYKYSYDIDNESTVITLADWYHIPAPIMNNDFGPTQSDATLINGLGRSPSTLTAPLAVISVIPGKRYRFRLVSISCDPNFIFSIDKHTMKVIEADGISVQPVTVDSIQIFAGQRYSFILTANKPTSNYWVRALPNTGFPSNNFAGGLNSAILRYVGAPATNPTTLQTASVSPLLETDLHPLTNPAAPGPPVPAALSNGAVFPVNLTLGFTEDAHFTINGVIFETPSVPVLLQMLSGAQTVGQLMPTGSVIELPPNKVIEITMNGGIEGEPHPIHLHGHSFSVVRSAGSSVYNYANPVRRDVVNTGTSTSDSVVIRFKTDNNGPWIVHCHIDWHFEHGLAVVLAENMPSGQQLAHPAAWDQLCPIYNALTP